MAFNPLMHLMILLSILPHDVFLSFRGADTRKNFTDHLYNALIKAGIHTFRDNEIRRGENIELEIKKAIYESKISVVVFSKDYATSSWCLDELVMIMERRRTVGYIVIPIFYDVDPSEVMQQTGRYGEAFAMHKKNFEEEIDRVEGWKVALKEFADMEGMVLNNRHESQFIQNIVEEVGDKLDWTVPSVARSLVGIDFRPLAFFFF